jgi:cyclophilin family peptidyl-prolyl cis-trans isomerase
MKLLSNAYRGRLLTVAALLLLVALVAACSGSPVQPAAEAPAAEAPAVEEAATPEAPAAEENTGSATAGEMATPVPPGTRAGDLDAAARNGMYSAPPEMMIDPDKFYYATLKTELGDIRLQLFADRAPITVNNFVFLAREGFYDDTQFHRVLEGFMAQAGDPTGSGSGGPGYNFQDEIVPGLEFDRPGLLAMANAGPGTNGSQFFITFAPTEWLTGLHTIFGEVLEGQDVLDSLTLRDPMAAPDFPGDALLTVEIEESDVSTLPTPTPAPPTPTPFAPSALDAADRPLAEVPAIERSNFFSVEPELTIEEGVTYTATMATAKGDVVFALDAANAPVAVNNFVTLANLGFYDGLPINAVTPDSVMIIGSPDSNLESASDAGYLFVPEVGLPAVPATGSAAYAPIQPGPDGILASGSILMIALAPPPAESAESFSFFATMTEGEEVLLSLVEGDLIESMTISSDE